MVWIVETDLPVNFATFRIEYPFFSKEIASLYSTLFCSKLFLLPGLRPNLPPFLNIQLPSAIEAIDDSLAFHGYQFS